MTTVSYLEGRPRDHRGEQECVLILLTAMTLPQMPFSMAVDYTAIEVNKVNKSCQNAACFFSATNASMVYGPFSNTTR